MSPPTNREEQLMENANNAEFWIKFAFQVFGLLVVIVPVVWKLVRAPLEYQLNGFGERLSRAEKSCSNVDGKLQAIEKQMEVSIFDRAAIHERMGSLEEKFQRFMDNAEMDRRNISKDDQKILERLASIEAKVDVVSTLKRALYDLKGSRNDTR